MQVLNDIDIICVYGKSNQENFSFLKKWLDEKEKRKLFFLEDDRNKFNILAKQINNYFTKENQNVQIVFIGNFEKDLKKLAWENVYLNLQCIKGSDEKRKDSFDKIFTILNELHLGASVTSYLYSDFGIKTFDNVYNNLLNADQFILFENLKNKFKNVPAIIAGAGPSLDKNIHLLKEVSNKALIFVGGSALNIFAKKNIKDHFAASIDQNPYVARFKENEIFEKPFFYQNQINYDNLSLVHSKKILLSDYGAYPLKSWIYDRLNIKQKTFEAGWTVTTFLIKIATLLGCNPIVMVGLDLCFKKQKYSKGVVKEKSEYSLIKTKDILNQDVYTQKDWLLAKNWIENYASINKDKTFINATEGGLKIENLKNMNLLKVVENLKNGQMDLNGLIHSVVSNESSIKLKKKNVLGIISEIFESLKKSDYLCDEYINDIEINDIDFNLLKLQNQIAYTHLLDPLWQIWKFLILRNIEKNEIHILLNKLLFFKNVIFQHLNLLGKFL